MSKSAKYKIAFTGTNSSGKTTMAMEVSAKLKKKFDVLAELVSSQDRKITWSDSHFPIDYRAHYGMITNLIHAEVQAELKGDCDVVVTDRSVLDLYSIAKTDFPCSPEIDALEGMILSWLSSYTAIYYLSPLAYQDDGKRPPDEFRMRTHATLLELIDKYNLDNLFTLDRHEIFHDVCDRLGIDYRNPILAEEEKWQAISKDLNVALAVKTIEWLSTSDLDVFIPIDNVKDPVDYTLIRDSIVKYFGEEYPLHLMTIPKTAVPKLCKSYKVYGL